MPKNKPNTIVVYLQVTNAEEWTGEIIKSEGYDFEKPTVSFSELENFKDGDLIKGVLLLSGDELSIIDISQVTDIEEVGGVVEDWTQIGSEWFSPDEVDLFTHATAIAKEGAFNLLITGGSGYGKTSRAIAWGQAHGMEVLRVNCQLTRDPEELFGYRQAVDGTTVFEPTDFSKLCESDVPRLIVLDEINRAEPEMLNGLFPLLDFARNVTVVNRSITLAPQIMFVASANIGAKFSGTFEIDAALNNRFGANLIVGPPPPHIEIKILEQKCALENDQATTLINVINRLRDSEVGALDELDLSTRSAIKVATLAGAGMSMRKAFIFSIVNSASYHDRKELMDIISSEGV